MHHKLIIKGIRAIIPGGISEQDFSAASEMDEFSSKELLSIFLHNGIGKLDDNIVKDQGYSICFIIKSIVIILLFLQL